MLVARPMIREGELELWMRMGLFGKLNWIDAEFEGDEIRRERIAF